MENVISARRLRKSMLNNLDYNEYVGNFYETKKENNKKRIGIKEKFLIKCVVSSIILFVTIFLINNYKQQLVNNKIIYRLYEHYKFDFKKEAILNNFESVIINLDGIMGDIIPKKVKETAINFYNNKAKNFILDFGYVNLDSKKENEIDLYDEPLAEESVINKNEVNIDVKNMLENISIITPTIGTVTSEFGERDEIFEGVNPYHTGIDIANKIGTDIVSSTDGVVSKIVLDDKYYGNYIEISIDDIIFKYAHLSEILVNENDVVTQNKIIGKMGSTGMSTGPHLHFEIRYNGQLIDPKTVIELK